MEAQNRMYSALETFKLTIASIHCDVLVVLLLSQKKLIELAISGLDIQQYFPDYKGGRWGVDAIKDFFVGRFLEIGKRENRVIQVICEDTPDTVHMVPIVEKILHRGCLGPSSEHLADISSTPEHIRVGMRSCQNDSRLGRARLLVPALPPVDSIGQAM